MWLFQCYKVLFPEPKPWATHDRTMRLLFLFFEEGIIHSVVPYLSGGSTSPTPEFNNPRHRMAVSARDLAQFCFPPSSCFPWCRGSTWPCFRKLSQVWCRRLMQKLSDSIKTLLRALLKLANTKYATELFDAITKVVWPSSPTHPMYCMAAQPPPAWKTYQCVPWFRDGKLRQGRHKESLQMTDLPGREPGVIQTNFSVLACTGALEQDTNSIVKIYCLPVSRGWGVRRMMHYFDGIRTSGPSKRDPLHKVSKH